MVAINERFHELPEESGDQAGPGRVLRFLIASFRFFFLPVEAPFQAA